MFARRDPATQRCLHSAQVAGRLADAFVEGIRFDVVSYQDNSDRDVRIAWQALRHDTENNVYLPTSIECKIGIVLSMKARVAGGDWTLVQKDAAKNVYSLQLAWVRNGHGKSEGTISRDDLKSLSGQEEGRIWFTWSRSW